MAILRERPYSQFNFLVDIGAGDAGGLEAGFSEVSGLDFEVQMIEYRNGNAKTNAPVKINGLAKVGNVTFRSGCDRFARSLRMGRRGTQGIANCAEKRPPSSCSARIALTSC